MATSAIWLKQLADGTEVALTSGPEDRRRDSRATRDDSFQPLDVDRHRDLSRAGHRGEPASDRQRLDADILARRPETGVHPQPRGRIALLHALRRLIRCTAVKEISSSTNEELSSPRWSPDGERIVVTKQPALDQRRRAAARECRRRIAARHHATDSARAYSPPGRTDDSRGLVFTELETVARWPCARRGGTARMLLYDLSSRRSAIVWNAHASADSSICSGAASSSSRGFNAPDLQEIALDIAIRTASARIGSRAARPSIASRRCARSIASSSRPSGAAIPTSWEIVPATARCGA